ncbi:hypothetical protein QBC45DRAFT_86568 [Copromyces sp. CBS 386.78]|nr:hypothetical protein QBC45DRAFT_86568 [Copromyces sp. CBS 386.78]
MYISLLLLYVPICTLHLDARRSISHHIYPLSEQQGACVFDIRDRVRILFYLTVFWTKALVAFGRYTNDFMSFPVTVLFMLVTFSCIVIAYFLLLSSV